MRSRLAVTAQQYCRVAYMTLAVEPMIVLAGAAVRLTGSGLGCPDWPTCVGNALPHVSTTVRCGHVEHVAEEPYSARLLPMLALPTRLSGPILIEPVVHGDARGFFLESYRRDTFERLGIFDEFVQDNHSRSRRGVVRGMHFQPGMAKHIRCASGRVLDVLVDIRRGSPTFGEWEGFELSDAKHHQLYCPDGFAHGFCVLSEVADLVYMTSSYYAPKLEGGFSFDDPDVGIEWPGGVELSASKRDSSAPRLAELEASLPFVFEGS